MELFRKRPALTVFDEVADDVQIFCRAALESSAIMKAERLVVRRSDFLVDVMIANLNTLSDRHMDIGCTYGEILYATFIQLKIKNL
jgi:hypothetical protein